jgi:hypothetical protein
MEPLGLFLKKFAMVLLSFGKRREKGTKGNDEIWKLTGFFQINGDELSGWESFAMLINSTVSVRDENTATRKTIGNYFSQTKVYPQFRVGPICNKNIVNI